MSGVDIENYAQPLEAVAAAEKGYCMPLPLKVEDRRRLFEKWCELNPKALDFVEMQALDYDVRGARCGTKYIIERLRWDSGITCTGVPFYDNKGGRHVYNVNNNDTPLVARWLLDKYPELDIMTRKSMFDEKKEEDGSEAQGD